MPRSSPISKISPRKQPSQARSSFTVQVILTAAARVLAKHSLEGFNTNRVAQVAGVSVGSLYQYFPNKDALTIALIVKEHEKLANAVEECELACNNQSLHKSISQLVQIAINHQRGNATYAAALDFEELRLPLPSSVHLIQKRLVEAVVRLLARHLPHVSDKALAMLSKECVLVCKALIESAPPEMTSVALKKRVVEWLMRRLT